MNLRSSPDVKKTRSKAKDNERRAESHHRTSIKELERKDLSRGAPRKNPECVVKGIFYDANSFLWPCSNRAIERSPALVLHERSKKYFKASSAIPSPTPAKDPKTAMAIPAPNFVASHKKLPATKSTMTAGVPANVMPRI